MDERILIVIALLVLAGLIFGRGRGRGGTDRRGGQKNFPRSLHPNHPDAKPNRQPPGHEKQRPKRAGWGRKKK